MMPCLDVAVRFESRALIKTISVSVPSPPCLRASRPAPTCDVPAIRNDESWARRRPGRPGARATYWPSDPGQTFPNSIMTHRSPSHPSQRQSKSSAAPLQQAVCLFSFFTKWVVFFLYCTVLTITLLITSRQGSLDEQLDGGYLSLKLRASTANWRGAYHLL